jgi:N-acetylneuraminic acid mutarotase
VKTKSGSTSAFFGLRPLIILVLCATIAFSILTGTSLAFFRAEEPAKISRRTLTFQERVSYQRAIEEVYWRHRIWPKERPDPKPSLDAVMSQAQLEKKVQDYLRESQALEDYRQRPITSEQLQDEMDRMAQHTKQPEALRELFEALGNDPFVIAECLARPILAKRLFKSALALQDANWAASQPVSSHKANGVSFYSYTLSRIVASSKEEGTCNDAWAATSTVNAPTARQLHTALWTGSEMIVWGGHDQNFLTLNTGGRYDPATDSWLPISPNNVPDARYSHTAVWTGTEMIVWGGDDQNILPLNTGSRYDPATDSWLATSTNNVPDARYGHTAVWTGSEMIVWGGFGDIGTLNTGARYNPSSDSWTATGTTNAPSPRYFHTAVWIGSEMIVWGGRGDTDEVNTGGRYNPGTDVWTTTSTTGAPDARESHTAVWTGDEMIVWGGFALSVGGLSTGG